MKTCTNCHESKPASEFYKAKMTRDKLTAHCKACMKAYNTQHQRDNKRGKWKDKSKIYLSTEIIIKLGGVFEKATQCVFDPESDVEMAIRILLAK